MALACAICVSGYSVSIKPVIGRYGALRMTSITMFIGGIGLWLLVGVAWGDWVNPADLFERPAGQWSAIMVLVLFNTVITQLLWIGGLTAVPDITRGSYLFFLKPVIAALLTWYFLAQPITGFQIVAMLIICSAVFIEPVWSKLRRKELAAREHPTLRARSQARGVVVYGKQRKGLAPTPCSRSAPRSLRQNRSRCTARAGSHARVPSQRRYPGRAGLRRGSPGSASGAGGLA